MLTKPEILHGEFTNCSACKACMGDCCQWSACENSPLDFDNDTKRMQQALESGKYSIDYVRTSLKSFIKKDGYLSLDLNHIMCTPNEALYIRPKNANRPLFDILHTDTAEGPCVFWSIERGCDLKYNERPMFGRLIIAVAPHECYPLYNRQNIANVWKPFTPLLFEIAKKNFPEDWQPYKDINFRL